MAKLRMAHASTHGARKPPGPIYKTLDEPSTCRNLIPLMAEAADALPSEPAVRTTREAETTTKSEGWVQLFLNDL